MKNIGFLWLIIGGFSVYFAGKLGQWRYSLKADKLRVRYGAWLEELFAWGAAALTTVLFLKEGLEVVVILWDQILGRGMVIDSVFFAIGTVLLGGVAFATGLRWIARRSERATECAVPSESQNQAPDLEIIDLDDVEAYSRISDSDSEPETPASKNITSGESKGEENIQSELVPVDLAKGADMHEIYLAEPQKAAALEQAANQYRQSLRQAYALLAQYASVHDSAMQPSFPSESINPIPSSEILENYIRNSGLSLEDQEILRQYVRDNANFAELIACHKVQIHLSGEGENRKVYCTVARLANCRQVV